MYIVDLYNLLLPIEDFLIKERQQKKKINIKKKNQCHDLKSYYKYGTNVNLSTDFRYNTAQYLTY